MYSNFVKLLVILVAGAVWTLSSCGGPSKNSTLQNEDKDPSVWSSLCPIEEQVMHEGIACCTADISESRCKTLAEGLSDHVKKSISIVHSREFPYNQVPNCYWSALNFKDENFSKPEAFKPYDGKQIDSMLQISNFKTTPDGVLGSIVTFYEQTTCRIKSWDENNCQVVSSFEFPQRLTHAGVQIAPGVIFQKENRETKAFSISTIELTRKHVKDLVSAKSDVIKSEISLRFYSRTDQ